MDLMQLHQIHLQLPQRSFSKAEEDVLHSIFSNPLVVRYLNHLNWEQMVDLANLSPVDFLKNPGEHNLRVAFLKGGISVLDTLLSIHKQEQPPEPTQ